MKTAEHSKLPWEVIDSPEQKGAIWIEVEETFTELGICDFYHMNEDKVIRKPNAVADAEFIVRAVNNHDRLLEACKEALKSFNKIRTNHGLTGPRPKEVLMLIEAIKAVEGE